MEYYSWKPQYFGGTFNGASFNATVAEGDPWLVTSCDAFAVLKLPLWSAWRKTAGVTDFTRFTVCSWCSFLIIYTWRSWSKDTTKSVVTPGTGTHPLLSHPFFHLSWGSLTRCAELRSPAQCSGEMVWEPTVMSSSQTSPSQAAGLRSIQQKSWYDTVQKRYR